jgi:hypothetical protein
VLAFALGTFANRLRISPLAGYLLAGLFVGPYTPGFIADLDLAQQLAEVGVILLMFGVGLHFSFQDLMSVRGIAVPGAVAQIAVATALGTGLALLADWSFGSGIVFGLCLSVASTVVLLRALEERGMLDSRAAVPGYRAAAEPGDGDPRARHAGASGERGPASRIVRGRCAAGACGPGRNPERLRGRAHRGACP